MIVLKKSKELISYQNSGQNMTYFNIVAADKQEVLHIRCYQRYKFPMISEGMIYNFCDMIKKDCCWIVSSSSIAYSARQETGTFQQHRLLLPEEEPPSGMKRTLRDALESPHKSTIIGNVVKVCTMHTCIHVCTNCTGCYIYMYTY